MEVTVGTLAAYGPYWIPGTIVIVVVALVVFYAHGGRVGQQRRMSRRHGARRPPD